MIGSERERIAHLEAQVRELSAELEAWRAHDGDAPFTLDRVTLAHLRMRKLLSDVGLRQRIGPAVVRLLLHLMDRSGRLVPRDVVYDTVVSDASADVRGKIVDVRVCDARSALAGLGLPRGAIETIWGQGYMMPPSFAGRLKALLEPASAEAA